MTSFSSSNLVLQPEVRALCREVEKHTVSTCAVILSALTAPIGFGLAYLIYHSYKQSQALKALEGKIQGALKKELQNNSRDSIRLINVSDILNAWKRLPEQNRKSFEYSKRGSRTTGEYEEAVKQEKEDREVILSYFIDNEEELNREIRRLRSKKPTLTTRAAIVAEIRRTFERTCKDQDFINGILKTPEEVDCQILQELRKNNPTATIKDFEALSTIEKAEILAAICRSLETNLSAQRHQHEEPSISQG